MGSRYSVQTSVQRVVGDAQLPNAIQAGVTRSIFEGGSIGKTIKDSLLNGAYRRLERAYDFAAEPGNYYYGLPNATLVGNDAEPVAITAAIESEVGYPITLEYAKFDYLNYTHLGYHHLETQLDYDEASNEVQTKSTEKGFPVYLEDMEPVFFRDPDAVTVAGSEEFWGRAPTAGYTPIRPTRDQETGLGSMVGEFTWREATAETAGVELQLIWEDAAKTVFREVVFVPLAPFLPQDRYYQAKYTYNDGTREQVGYWIYAPGTGTYPDLDAGAEVNYSTPGSYFPFLIFRHNGADFSHPDQAGQAHYDTSVDLGKRMGMDFAEVAEQLRGNPGWADIAQAVAMMGVPINSQEPVEMHYLFDFFADLHARSPEGWKVVSEMNKIAGPEVNGPPRTLKKLVLRDVDFHMAINYMGTERQIRPGSIGPVGSYTNTSEPLDVTYPNQPGFEIKRRFYRRQLTTSLYEEIAVIDPQLEYEILAYKGKSTYAGQDDGRFLIPLDRSIAGSYNLRDREQLYYRALHFVINAYQKEDVEWYETGAFATFMTALAIVITIVSLGSLSAPSSALIAAIGVIGAWAVTLLVYLVKAEVLKYLFAEVAEEIGLEAAAILALVTAVYSFGDQMFSEQPGQGFWAETLLAAPNGLIAGAGNILADDFKALQGEIEYYEAQTREMQAELKEAQELLDSGISLDPFTFIGKEPAYVLGESPKDYFSRTVHSGNVGALSFEIVRSFVEQSLKLPTVEDTLGESLA